jgi:hypothetical protein
MLLKCLPASWHPALAGRLTHAAQRKHKVRPGQPPHHYQLQQPLEQLRDRPRGRAHSVLIIRQGCTGRRFPAGSCPKSQPSRRRSWVELHTFCCHEKNPADTGHKKRTKDSWIVFDERGGPARWPLCTALLTLLTVHSTHPTSTCCRALALIASAQNQPTTGRLLALAWTMKSMRRSCCATTGVADITHENWDQNDEYTFGHAAAALSEKWPRALTMMAAQMQVSLLNRMLQEALRQQRFTRRR